MSKPILKKTITEENLVELRAAVQEYVDFYDTIEEDDGSEDMQEDYEHPIMEKAVEIFLGKDIWKNYINKFFV